MRRDTFQAIAVPARKAITILIAIQVITTHAAVKHFDTT